MTKALLLTVALAGCVATHGGHSAPTWARVADAAAAGSLGVAAMVPAVTPDARVAYGAMGLALGIAVVDMVVLWRRKE